MGRLLRGVLVLTGCAGIAGIAVGVAVLVWPQPEPRVRVGDLVVGVRPLAGGGAQFVVPASAPLEEFPAGVGCPPEALGWLHRVGRQRVEGFAVTLRNGGSGDGVLRVSEIRADGVRALVPEPVLAVRCGATAPDDGTAARVELDTDGGAPATPAGGPPFEVGLAAGEQLDLRVLLAGRQDFRGSFSARVSDGSRTGVVALLPPGATEVDRPGFGQPGALTVEVAEPAGDTRFRCAEPDRAGAGDAQPCSAAGVRARVARLWERPELAGSALTAALSSYGCGDTGRLAGALDQVWRGYYGRDPGRGEHAYDAVIRRPVQALADSCGREVAVAALDATGAASAGGTEGVRGALLAEGTEVPPPPATAAGCDEVSLRAAPDDEGFPDGFRAHGCSPPYALVESSRAGTGYVLFWLLEVVGDRWTVRASTAVGPDTSAGRPLFACGDLAAEGLDVDAMRAALGAAEASAARPLCG